MSGFDENPFADPAVVRAANSSGQKPPTLEDYNPFDPNNAGTGNVTSATTNSTSSVPAVLEATQQPQQGAARLPGQEPPPYTQSGEQQITTADFQRRQEELERRARDLERREEELKNTPYNARQNNWPPVPSFCPFQPCFYQDINVDIPVEFQRMVRYLYYLWVSHIGLLLANMLVGLLYLFVGGDKGQTFGLALVYWAIFTPASFVCWFRPAYKAFRDDSSFNFMVFFFVFFFQFLVSVLYALGIGGMGSCGIIVAISEITAGEGKTIFVGVLMLMTGIGFGLCALGDFYMLVTIHKMYRSTGASLARAQAEFTSGVMRNEQVQQAAAAAARDTVRSQFGANTGGSSAGQNQQGPRY